MHQALKRILDQRIEHYYRHQMHASDTRTKIRHTLNSICLSEIFQMLLKLNIGSAYNVIEVNISYASGTPMDLINIPKAKQMH